jgi:hypothetical protein
MALIRVKREQMVKITLDTLDALDKSMTKDEHGEESYAYWTGRLEIVVKMLLELLTSTQDYIEIQDDADASA